MTQNIAERTVRNRKTKTKLPLQKNTNHVIGVVGNTLWILDSEKLPTEAKQTLKIHGVDQDLTIDWFTDHADFCLQSLAGHNLLENGDFGGNGEKSLVNWSIEAEAPATGGVDLSPEWHLETGHTAFLFAPVDEPRPCFIAKQKIPVTDNGNLEYRFAGFFSTHRAGGIVTLSYYDHYHNKINEDVINVSHAPEYVGGKSLKHYVHIESVFTPIKGAEYIHLKIELGKQIDLSQPNSYLFFTRLFLGINNEAQDQLNIPYSPGSYQLSLRILEENWSSFGKITLPEIDKTQRLNIEYLNSHYELDLTHELSVMQVIEKNRKIDDFKTHLFLKQQALDGLIATNYFNFGALQCLNKDYCFTSLYELIRAVVLPQPPHAIKLYSDARENAQFYVQLGIEREKQGQKAIAKSCYQIALHFHPHPVAYEHLGNFALTDKRFALAQAHYQQAIALNTQSYWAYANLSSALMHEGLLDKAVENLQRAILEFPESKLVQDKLTETLRQYWQEKTEYFSFLATIDARETLLAETEKAVHAIADVHRRAFLRVSDNAIGARTEYKKVLLIADTFLPQCLRYRVKQKLEQLVLAGFDAKYISWTEADQASQEIPWYDCIIFYRAPALPDVVQLIEYARSLGKPTLYEIDDLIFEPIYPPTIASYGGQVTPAQYYDLLKGMALYRCAAQLCDYALASTQPLLERLMPLVRNKQGFLHRNALDSNNVLKLKPANTNEAVTIFYGSGTLAHNSDFIEEVLPALEKILQDFKQVRLMIAGYLQLPPLFSRKYKKQIITLPFTKNLYIYNTYLQGADINIAVLKQDAINDCKSELKWFEAACFGIPSVVSQTRNYQDVIRQGEDGFMASSINDWYETLKQLITQPDLRQRVGYAAYQRVEQEYTLPVMAENIKHIFTMLNEQLTTVSKG